MGCDIHLFAESRIAEFQIEGWEVVPGFGVCHDDGYPCCEYFEPRNYDLFSILAGVRNVEGFLPIDEPRGIPEDATKEIRQCLEDHDIHTTSWFTLEELLQFDWTQTATKKRIVSASAYAEWSRWRREEGLGPESYCAAVFGSRVQMLEEGDMRRRILELTAGVYVREQTPVIENAMPRAYCEVEWDTSYHRAAPSFWSETIPRLLRAGDHECHFTSRLPVIRILFGFDN